MLSWVSNGSNLWAPFSRTLTRFVCSYSMRGNWLNYKGTMMRIWGCWPHPSSDDYVVNRAMDFASISPFSRTKLWRHLMTTLPLSYKLSSLNSIPCFSLPIVYCRHATLITTSISYRNQLRSTYARTVLVLPETQDRASGGLHVAERPYSTQYEPVLIADAVSQEARRFLAILCWLSCFECIHHQIHVPYSHDWWAFGRIGGNTMFLEIGSATGLSPNSNTDKWCS